MIKKLLKDFKTWAVLVALFVAIGGYTQVPLEHIRKGLIVFCGKCKTKIVKISNKTLYCEGCGEGSMGFDVILNEGQVD